MRRALFLPLIPDTIASNCIFCTLLYFSPLPICYSSGGVKFSDLTEKEGKLPLKIYSSVRRKER